MITVQLKSVDGNYPNITDVVNKGDLRDGEEVIVRDHSAVEQAYGLHICKVHQLQNAYELQDVNGHNCWYTSTWR